MKDKYLVYIPGIYRDFTDIFAVVSEQEEETSASPDQNLDLLKCIAQESFFPGKLKTTVPGVVGALTVIMDNVDVVDHSKICDYIIDIQK